MKRIVLIKEGEYRPSLFADFVETVNQPEAEQVGFYARHDYTFRLTRNRSSLEPASPLALAHYNVNVASEVQDPVLFRPIDTELVFEALNKYDYVMFGTITPTHIVSDQHLLPNALYIARNAHGKLVNAITDEVLQPDSNKVTFVTTFFGVIRMEGLPVYVVVLNSSMTHVTDGFDYHHRATDTLYSIVTDHDGSIRDAVFAPKVIYARQFGETLLSNESTVVLDFFSTPSVLRGMEMSIDVTASTIDTNLSYHTEDNKIVIYTDKAKPFGFFNIKFHCGPFFDVAGIIEQPTFNYLIIRQ